MESTLHSESNQGIGEQALWITLHTGMAFGSWVFMMIIVSLTRPQIVPVAVTWSLSFIVPFVVGYIMTKIRQDDVAANTWLIGLIWFLIICLWVLEMPTGPNQCYHCDATQKIVLSFFSTTEDSNLLDGQCRFIGTWPATALCAYGIASGLALKKKRPE